MILRFAQDDDQTRMNFAHLEEFLKSIGEKPFRLKQVRHAVFTELVSNWNGATTLSKPLRDQLTATIPFTSLELVRESKSSRGDTIKAMFKLADGNMIETVLMRHDRDRNTVCVSSQAGCAMKCAFCATGKLGFKRNLTTEEIVDQVMHFARYLGKEQKRVSNIVVMGMGEPMANYENMIGALRFLNAEETLNISARKMTVSTCGIVPGILRLADEPMQLNLAISLHAPTEEIRSQIMPVNKAYPLEKLMAAVHEYVAKTNRKVLFEYVMLEGVNDTPACAVALAKLMNHPLFQVNLIKYHSTGVFTPTEEQHRLQFKAKLEDLGCVVTHRVTFGEDIDAACGQLANKNMPHPVSPSSS